MKDGVRRKLERQVNVEAKAEEARCPLYATTSKQRGLHGPKSLFPFTPKPSSAPGVLSPCSGSRHLILIWLSAWSAYRERFGRVENESPVPPALHIFSL